PPRLKAHRMGLGWTLTPMLRPASTGAPPPYDEGWLEAHLSRREVLHDLDRAAADRHDLGLAIDALDLGAAQVAGTTEDLHRLVGAELQGRRREVLEHADLGHRLLALPDPPGQQFERRLH